MPEETSQLENTTGNNNPNEEEKKKRRKIITSIFCIAATVALAGAIVGIIFGIKGCSNGSGDNWWDHTASLKASDIGTTREVNIGGRVHKVRLIGVDHELGLDTQENVHTTWEFVDVLTKPDGTPYITKYGDDNTSFHHLSETGKIAKYLIELKEKLPNGLLKKIQKIERYVSMADDRGDYVLTLDGLELSPLCYCEIFNEQTADATPYSMKEGASGTQNKQYKYYENHSAEKKCPVGSTTPVKYWLASPDKAGGTTGFSPSQCAITIDENGVAKRDLCVNEFALAPIFAI